jgi:hypothetical protein
MTPSSKSQDKLYNEAQCREAAACRGSRPPASLFDRAKSLLMSAYSFYNAGDYGTAASQP